VSLLGLFQREVAVEIGPENGPGVRLADLRVTFKATHKASKAASTAQIDIYNPAPSSIALLRAPLAAIRLLVGYTPVPRVIFQGPPIKDGIELQIRGGDRILKVDAADGGRAYVGTSLNVSMMTPTTFGQILAMILAETLWTRGHILVPEGLVLPHGVVLQGRPGEVLDRLAAAVPPAGADWFVSDNTLYIVPKGQATPEAAPLISASQGNLIGSPTQTKTGVKVRALIDATMRPGRVFVVESGLITGTFVARDVLFTGDSG
jgi:hypothetical protein